jgi:hypothetical protein
MLCLWYPGNKVCVWLPLSSLSWSALLSNQFGFGLWYIAPLSITKKSIISWCTVLLEEKTADLLQVTDKLYHIILYQYTLPWAGFELTTLVVVDTNCIDSCKSNFHTIMTMTVPVHMETQLLDNIFRLQECHIKFKCITSVTVDLSRNVILNLNVLPLWQFTCL